MKSFVPGGIISIEHTWPLGNNYIEHSATLLIESEPKLESAYFWAQQFWFSNGDGGYMGIQTGGDLHALRQKIAIFSIWKALAAEKSTITNSFAGPFDHEGSGFSCKIPFEWKEGTMYILKLKNIESDTWWEASIEEVESTSISTIGRIQVPENWGNLKSKSNFFIEYFRPVNQCEDLPFEKTYFGEPVMKNNMEVRPNEHKICIYGKCISLGRIVENTGSTFTVETGK
jgi:hypothetical protein